MLNSGSRLRSTADETIAGWRAELDQSEIRVSRLHLCGSLRTGLLPGTKPPTYTTRPQEPPSTRVLEIDVRIILDPTVDQFHPTVITAIEQITGALQVRSGVVTRWERKIPQVSLYRSTPWMTGVSLEWDISVNTEPYLETAFWWDLAYSSEEIARQREIRRSAIAREVPRDVYETLKTLDAQELRWRLCTALSSNIDKTNKDLKKFLAKCGKNPILTASIAQAERGELQRPNMQRLLYILNRYCVIIPPPAPPPPWVDQITKADR